MPVKVNWDNRQKTIIRFDFNSRWEWTDYLAALEKAEAMFNQVDHAVDTIANLQNSAPLDPATLREVHHALHNTPRNMGRIVVTPTSPLVRAMANAFSQIFHQQPECILLAESLSDARKILTDNHRR
jgi:hypothetical protein